MDDLAHACLYLMASYEEEEIVNVGVSEDLSIRDLVGLLKEVVGYEGEVIFDHSKPDGMYQKLLHVYHINSLGWKADIPIKKGIKMTYSNSCPQQNT